MTHVQIRKVNWDADDSMCAEDGGYKYQDNAVDYDGFCVMVGGEVVLQVEVRGGLKGEDDEFIEITGEYVCYLEGIERAIRFDPDLVLLPSRLDSRVWEVALSAALER